MRTTMVSVVVTQSFDYRGRAVCPGDALQMEPIDAAIQARAGYVSLLHGPTYQTRMMVAESAPLPVVLLPTRSVVETPAKRRRGRRARKTQV